MRESLHCSFSSSPFIDQVARVVEGRDSFLSVFLFFSKANPVYTVYANDALIFSSYKSKGTLSLAWRMMRKGRGKRHGSGCMQARDDARLDHDANETGAAGIKSFATFDE